MILNRNEDVRLCLFNIREREAGSMDKDGKTINWDSAVQLVGIPWEDTNGSTRKYNIEPSHVQEISALLEDVHWGCIVDISISQRQVVSLKVVSDVMLPVYANEPVSLD